MRPSLLPIVLAASMVLLGASALPAGFDAAARKPVERAVLRARDLWATINVCDTAAKPNTIGIRGSMPGLTRWARAAMRFQVQYLGKDGAWRAIPQGADSGWKPLGRMRDDVVEAGQDFAFQPPADGGAHHLRGVVRFRWTRSRRVVRRARRVTEAGHRSTAGADPAGFSAAACDITAP